MKNPNYNKTEKKRINGKKRYGGRNINESRHEAAVSMSLIGSAVYENPDYSPTRHTKQTYRSQQRAAIKRRKAH